MVQSTWFVKNLGDAMLADIQLTKIKCYLKSAYLDQHSPKDTAAFIRHESNGRLHCQVKVYLSPKFVTGAKQISAQQCPRPSINDLSLFIGSKEAWSLLFPKKS